jgi:SepF-like predicted cell division protein (DUF552 family)
VKFWKKEYDEILGSGSPQETLGISKEDDFFQIPNMIQNFMIRKYELNSVEQVSDIKRQLMGKNILIVNATNILKNITNISELKEAIDDIKSYLKKCGGSLGRIGENYLIITPSSSIKIAN